MAPASAKPMSPTFLAAAIAGAQDAFVTKNLDGIIQSWNEGATELFGYTAEEAIGQPIYLLIPMDRMIEEREILRRVRNGERIEQYETVRLTKEGKRIAVSVTISPVKDAQGRVIGASKVARRAVTGILPVNPQFASTILDLLPFALYVCDAHGVITAYNRYAAEMWGRTPSCGDEFFCGSFRLFHPDGTPMPHAECPMAQAIRNGEEPGEQEIVIERPDGTRLFALAHPILIRDPSGRPLHAVNCLQDVTDRKRDEEVRAQYEAIVRGSNDGIISKSLDGTIRTWNPAAEAIFGYAREEAIGRNIAMLIPADRLHEEAEIVARMRRGESSRFETERLRKDGTRLPVEVMHSPIYNASGKIIGVSKIVRDITSRKADERAHSHLAAIVESAGDAIIGLDMNGVIQTWNTSAHELFGFSEDEVVGKPISVLIPDDRRHDERHILERIRHGERVSHYETVRITKDGQRLELSLTISPIHDAAGNVVGASKTARDIGNQKHAERSIARLNRDLRGRVNELQTLFAVAPIGIIIAEDVECATLSINAAAARLLNLNPKEKLLLGPDHARLPFRAFSHGRELLSEERPLWQAAHFNRDVRGAEIDIVRDDGTTLHTLVYASPLHDDDGAVRGGLGIIVDMTGRRRTEREVLKAQHMESIGVLAGGIAHDFNNILTALFGNISLARLALDNDSPALLSLNQAEQAFMRARDLTQQLLTFSRGGAPIRKTASIGEFLKEAVTFLLHGASVRAVFDVDPNLWPAEVDLGQLNQVVNNLVINAKEAMPHGGTLQVGARNVTLIANDPRPLRPGRYLEITFADNGSGIPDEYVANIFDPYFTTKRTGTGLGLATTYSIIKRHEGDISVNSRLGEGTRFSIYLPASSAAVLPDAPTREAANGTGRILLMDDEPAVRAVASALLERLGYRLTLAESGEDALAMYRAAAERGDGFDAVILDLTVPGGMGGLECLRRLHEIDPEVHALVSSGYSNDPIMANYQDYGFSGVLAKPYRLGDVSEALEHVLGARPSTRILPS